MPIGAGQGWGGQLARQADTALRNDGDGDGDRSHLRQVTHQEGPPSVGLQREQLRTWQQGSLERATGRQPGSPRTMVR